MHIRVTGGTSHVGRDLVDAAGRAGHASVATEDVALRLCRVLDDGSGGLLPGFAGPEPMLLFEAARVWREVRGVRKPLLAVPVPGPVAAGFRAGHHTVPDAPQGALTWRAWLEREAGAG